MKIEKEEALTFNGLSGQPTSNFHNENGRSLATTNIPTVVPVGTDLTIRTVKVSTNNMNFDGIKVVFRTGDKFISARLELECERAFAVIFENEPRPPKEVPGQERMEMDVQFLRKINEAEYLYQKLVELPKPGRSGPVRPGPESGAVRQGNVSGRTADG